MARQGAFSMDDYVTVAERVVAFYDKYPDGSLQAELLELNEQRVVVRAYAYRTADDGRPGIAHSSLTIPGATPYTRGSEIENAETSAIGRAIAMLGFEVKRGIASQDEVRGKGGTTTEPERTDDGGLVGNVELSKGQTTLEVRQGPEGDVVTFRLRSGRGGIKVVAKGPIATAVAMLGDELVGQRVTCFGRVTDEQWTPKGKTQPVTYQVLTLERMTGNGFAVPAPMAVPKAEWTAEEMAELDEAVSIGMGLVEDEPVGAA